ncbi:hypothetical protein [Krasilnikovia sp. M28-CT-15]|uniref:hypothetical protein n=1 Tax=Krasilnikovia sp. M28-CT-15 TaxID=3373540 RepID=UPI00387602E5
MQFFARRMEQVARVVVHVDTDEVPELWATDLAVSTRGTDGESDHERNETR